jgi:hypothetical protein
LKRRQVRNRTQTDVLCVLVRDEPGINGTMNQTIMASHLTWGLLAGCTRTRSRVTNPTIVLAIDDHDTPSVHMYHRTRSRARLTNNEQRSSQTAGLPTIPTGARSTMNSTRRADRRRRSSGSTFESSRPVYICGCSFFFFFFF